MAEGQRRRGCLTFGSGKGEEEGPDDGLSGARGSPKRLPCEGHGMSGVSEIINMIVCNIGDANHTCLSARMEGTSSKMKISISMSSGSSANTPIGHTLEEGPMADGLHDFDQWAKAIT